MLRGGQAIASVPQGQLDDERRKRVRGRHRRDPCSRIGPPLQSRSPADLVHWQRDSRRQLGRQRPHRPLGQRVDSNVWRRRPSTKSNDCGWKRHRRWRRAPLTGHAPEWHWESTEFLPPRDRPVPAPRYRRRIYAAPRPRRGHRYRPRRSPRGSPTAPFDRPDKALRGGGGRQRARGSTSPRAAHSACASINARTAN